MKLLNIDSNAKTVKGQKKGYLTAILYLAPAKSSGYQVCASATPGCIAACLNTAGRGQMNMVQEARIRKTKMFFEQRKEFMLQLEKEIEVFIKYAAKKDMIPTVRLNGTSDLFWSRLSFVGKNGQTYESMIHRFPKIQFYDYTKHAAHGKLPKNYNLTFSLAENNEPNALKAIEQGMNVAVVFRNKDLPKKYLGLRVLNADETDLRFLDKKKSIAGLYAKGKARKDASGFVKDVP